MAVSGGPSSRRSASRSSDAWFPLPMETADRRGRADAAAAVVPAAAVPMAVIEVVAYIGVGSNLNDPRTQVRRALAALEDLPDTRCGACSSLYTSPPMGPPDQPPYVNAVACLVTRLAPLSLLAGLQGLEQAHGRVRDGIRWGPRTLDLDILTYGDRHIDLPELQVPHPGIPQRAFVLYPLAEIAPQDLCIPGMGLVSELLASCPPDGLRRLEARK